MFTFKIIDKCFELFGKLLVDIQNSQSDLALKILNAIKDILG